MKETGLMFKAPLVRAILSGQKAQTRRVVKPQPAEGQGMVNAAYCGHPHLWLRDGHCDESDPTHEWRCPMGQPGDRIYVRETFARVPTVCGSDELVFAADYLDGSDKEAGVKYTPAIHMFKEDARIWLEVTRVRVERLHDISEADASREGLAYSTERMGHWCGNGRDWQMTARQAFRDLWIETGGNWAANPWVWVINFKRIEKA